MQPELRRTISAGRVLPALVSFFAMGCGGVSEPEVEVIEEVEFAASLQIDLTRMTKTSSGLYYEDLAAGSGDPAAAGDEVQVAYAGWLKDGTEFDRGQFGFGLGAGQVVAGFDEGTTGMRVGGLRKIIVPPALGYGSRGSGPVPPNAIMVFQIELLSLGDSGP